MKHEEAQCVITVELDDKMAHDLAYMAQWEHCSVEELVERYLKQRLKEIPN